VRLFQIFDLVFERASFVMRTPHSVWRLSSARTAGDRRAVEDQRQVQQLDMRIS
jgi:hypothetical protein